jgi:hypothetical protein
VLTVPDPVLPLMSGGRGDRFESRWGATALPAAFQRLGGDPAFGSGPLVTVFQDLLSITVYLAIVVAVVVWGRVGHPSGRSKSGRIDERGMPSLRANTATASTAMTMGDEHQGLFMRTPCA